MFSAIGRCWICDSRTLTRYHECRFDLREYATQDPELAAYSDQRVWLVRCESCGFGQPERLPTLPGFFDRMYDQRWSPEWVEREFEATYKDFIFHAILRELDKRLRVRPPSSNGQDGRRRLLDVGAHAGRFMQVAKQAGWSVEGIELNPTTAACAARRTGAPVHQLNAQALVGERPAFDAITLTDVLEHIPDPVRMLVTLRPLLKSDGLIAVKVPCGPSQWRKERVLSRIVSGREVSLAGNLVHVNHFSPKSLKLALERAGFGQATVQTAPPELTPDADGRCRTRSNGLRLSIYVAARLPLAVHTPLALNLQAYAASA
jgi:SAM-dependent methyltransferase